jgi:hypothetical protein
MGLTWVIWVEAGDPWRRRFVAYSLRIMVHSDFSTCSHHDLEPTMKVDTRGDVGRGRRDLALPRPVISVSCW